MRLIHLSDLHLGKNIGSYSLIEEQKFALDEIISIIKKEEVDLVMIAGDIFDTTIPSAEALDLYSNFLEEVVFDLKKKVLAISGNHDSSKRLDINKKFFRSNNYYLISEYEKSPLTFEDEYGKVNFYLIPFISINKARTIFNPSIDNFTDLYKFALKDIGYEDRNVLISHCYASSMKEDKEAYDDGQKPLTIGGYDMMDASVFEKFDYVALGHLHRAHFVLDPKIRYAGTFMKYSFDEENQSKSVTLVDLKEKAEIRKIYLPLLRDFEVRRGLFEDLLREKSTDSYIKFILEDSSIIENAMAKVKEKFPRAVSISYANKLALTREDSLDIDLENKDILELFSDFYKFKMDEDLKDKDKEVIKRIIACDQED